MRTFVIYREQSDHARAVETLLHDFTRQTGRVLETVSPDTPEGARLAEIYDIVEYPSLVALDDNGIVQNIWRGVPLPTISEVSYYAR